MAPFFGTSSFVWTNIIGVIMIALSIGYVAGGKLADRKPKLDILLKLLLAACAFLALLPFVAFTVAQCLSSNMWSIGRSLWGASRPIQPDAIKGKRMDPKFSHKMGKIFY